ncbi:hypothetical protein EKD04_025575 [Chloroflexales bacterium ZM16-3]|nr:hypothetical protein [Chloroflexales bacterium ZM16-3]
MMQMDFLPANVYDHAASVRWAARVRARPRACYWNALRALRVSRGALGVYVEGFAACDSGLVLEHGWIETPDGRVIDPTFPLLPGNAPESPYRYMPVLRFTVTDLNGMRSERFPRYCDGGRDFRMEREEPWASTRQAAYAEIARRVEVAAVEAGRTAMPHAPMVALLRGLLDPYASAPTECDGQTRVVAHLLTVAGVPFRAWAGRLRRGDTVIAPHLWVTVGAGQPGDPGCITVDYRRRMWVGTDVAEGVLLAGDLGDTSYDLVEQIALGRLNAAVFLALTCDIAKRFA